MLTPPDHRLIADAVWPVPHGGEPKTINEIMVLAKIVASVEAGESVSMLSREHREHIEREIANWDKEPEG